ncbi:MULTISPECIES: hypothetical protein [Rhodococcus]|uniref:hypothetical protein n=1 Tax=Rhodococcus TaxID=1827 RepID=UPI00029A6A01|nr:MULTISPECIES: hypothetical protein [Rhodococcus]ATQ30871.1 hypothetical protein CS378_20460 [Rhodococcus ruber]AUM16571.1 hypothetical protein CSW53_08530 [Rhodococcus ruber]MBD8052194.1 hypothetical protein [Rhodococcus ruber]MCF8784254.1 hypothetical protein [Rhodococcus ruber]
MSENFAHRTDPLFALPPATAPHPIRLDDPAPARTTPGLRPRLGSVLGTVVSAGAVATMVTGFVAVGTAATVSGVISAVRLGP